MPMAGELVAAEHLLEVAPGDHVPNVARRSSAITTPPLNVAATIVVPRGSALAMPLGKLTPAAPGSNSGQRTSGIR
jgi:hypothetical protein